uniref:Secreted protein n=1 Tax=Lutzomyia longipalpis TaxID=7200 RepID=A0A7G3B754_LUTLO
MRRSAILAIWMLVSGILCALLQPVSARVAGKIGYNNNYYSGRSYSGINEEIIYVSIGMGVTIAVLIR